jgi:hypothetical protein
MNPESLMGERVASQNHERNQPPDRLLAISTDSDQSLPRSTLRSASGSAACWRSTTRARRYPGWIWAACGPKRLRDVLLEMYPLFLPKVPVPHADAPTEYDIGPR